ncbi:hypothetical protein [Pseudomonas citronellolis]|uniref:hypothetical protein n=1 Tax=Pseudomonas citronellolis TaxID=53408 RepID=UPI0023E407D7|nr:hypothetical protein [Pseudomonas citronellolis]MDF3931832.1 hypothetical protein [Pseudomonas citronellolis]
MNKSCFGLVSAVLLAAVSAPSVALADDIGVGVGVSYVFGSQGGFTVGVKAFSNDEDNETVGSVGLDYVITSGAFRPNIGAAYQGQGYFGGADVGFNLKSQEIDFGVGGGWSNSDDDKKAPPKRTFI